MIISRSISAHWSGFATVDGLCCDGAFLRLRGRVFSSFEMVTRKLKLVFSLLFACSALVCIIAFTFPHLFPSSP